MNLRRSEKSKVLMMALSGAMFILSASTHMFGQTSADFLSLQKHINKQVTVETQDGKVTGQLLRVEESRLVVYEAGKPRPIPQESVKKVTLHKSRHTAAWVAGTSAAGFGLGFVGGFSAFNNTKDANRKIATIALYEAGIGAAAGFGLSRIGKRDEVIFQPE
jgi:hypothetical protein